MSIAIVDCGIGNIRSIANAIESLGQTPIIAGTPSQLESATKIILPGVGAFPDGMRALVEGDWPEHLDQHVRHKGKHFLGLCLGMQLLATTGTEHSSCSGMGWIAGSVELLCTNDPTLRVPHIGWNNVFPTGEHKMYDGLVEDSCFYFVHSYVFKPTDSRVISATCHHGTEFAASIAFENIWATQYHPEKSQQAGLTVLRNFLEANV